MLLSPEEENSGAVQGRAVSIKMTQAGITTDINKHIFNTKILFKKNPKTKNQNPESISQSTISV